MKHSFLLTFFAVFYMNTALSQAYIPFIEGDKMWTEDCVSSANPYYHYVGICTFDNDTLINGLLYKKIIDQINTTIISYIREDTIEKKVYCIMDPPVYCEFLLYDFNLQAGDTFYSEYTDTNCTSENFQMYAVADTVQFFAGMNRKKITFISFPGAIDSLIWYEGIGSLSNGIFTPDFYVGGFCYLLCYFEDSILLYHNDSLSTNCFVGIDRKNNEEPKLFDYFIKNNVLYLNTKLNLYYFSLHDIMGREILQKKLIRNSEIYLDDLLPCIYIFSIYCDENNYIESEKIFITH